MTDHANELRRYSRKIGRPAGDVPSVMLAAADEIERLAARLEAAEKERDFAKAEIARLHDDIHELTDVRVLDKEDRDRIVAHLQGEAKVKLDRLEAAEKELAELRSSMKFRTSLIGRTEAERDALRAKIEQMERQLLDRLEEAEKERDALRAKIEQMERQKPSVEYFDWLPQGTTHIGKIRSVTIPCFGFEARFNAFKYIDGVLYTYRTDTDNEYGEWVKAASRYRDGVLPTVYPLSCAQGEEK